MVTMATKHAASATTITTSRLVRLSPAAVPLTSVRTIIARMSSMTAAPRIIFASLEAIMPMSWRTLAVIPTLVATSAAAMNIASTEVKLSRMDT